GQEQAVAVLVLEPFAIEGCATGGGAHQEAAGANIARRPGQIANPLEAEHGVNGIERDQRVVVGTVGGGEGNPGGHGAGLGDPLLQDLAYLVLPVVHHLFTVVGHVLLPTRRVNAQLSEHPLHAEGARLVWHNGDDAFADLLVLDENRQHPHESHGGGNLTPA